MICVKFTAFCDVRADLRIRLATLRKPVRKFWFCLRVRLARALEVVHQVLAKMQAAHANVDRPVEQHFVYFSFVVFGCSEVITEDLETGLATSRTLTRLRRFSAVLPNTELFMSSNRSFSNSVLACFGSLRLKAI